MVLVAAQDMPTAEIKQNRISCAAPIAGQSGNAPYPPIDILRALIHYWDMESRRGNARRMASGKRRKEGRTPIWAVSSKMLAFYLVVFWLLCAAGAALMIRSQAAAPADGDFGDAALATLIGVGGVGIGAAVTSLILTLAVEAIMVLAQMLKQRQYEQGLEEGVEIGREETRQQYEQAIQQQELARQQRDARLRAWAAERGIPADELPDMDEPPANSR